MTIQRQDFVYPALNSQIINLTLVDGGVPFNLTGYGVVFKLAPQPGAEATVQKTAPAGVAIINAVLGQISITLLNTDVPDSGLYFWSVDVTKDPNLQVRFWEGRMAFKPSPAPQG